MNRNAEISSPSECENLDFGEASIYSDKLTDDSYEEANKKDDHTSHPCAMNSVECNPSLFISRKKG